MTVAELTDHIWDEAMQITIRRVEDNTPLHVSTTRFYSRAYDDRKVADWCVCEGCLTVWLRESE